MLHFKTVERHRIEMHRENRQRKAEYVKALEGYVALHKIDLSSQLQGLLFAIGCESPESFLHVYGYHT